ncbi:MAG: Hpt domain-containing protein [Nitrospira sp.]|nr:Hpt domain-containing protein [Nitrospira sp.]
MMESQPAMDLSAALDRFDGDHELLLTLAGMFVERSAQALAALRAAHITQDLPLLAKEAHKLRGSALEFCAQPAVAAAAQLEASAREAAGQDIAPHCEQVCAEMQRLTAALEEIIRRGFAS